MLNKAKVQKMIAAKQVKKQKGASMIEYALVVAGVAAIGVVLFNSTDGSIYTGITSFVTTTMAAL